MKSPTLHYKSLLKDLSDANQITRGINKLECKSDFQELKLQSYVLLCHAAVEQYIENLGSTIALEARKIYTSSGIITKSLVALISAKLVEDARSKARNKITAGIVSNIESFSSEAFNAYRRLIQDNHGIKKENLKTILIPIGVDPETVDVALINSMHAFGTKRGDFAHKFKLTRVATLASIKSDIDLIRDNLRSYDEAACEALKRRLK